MVSHDVKVVLPYDGKFDREAEPAALPGNVARLRARKPPDRGPPIPCTAKPGGQSAICAPPVRRATPATDPNPARSSTPAP